MAEERGLDPAADRVPPRRPRSSGDGWVYDDDGRKYWGLFGAAGLLVFHPDRGILLQHRALWSHFGGTWGIPGGARHEGESAPEAAAREAGEEAGVPGQLLRLRFCSVVDLGMWSYTTVAAEATESFTPVISDPESLELRWVGLDEVGRLDLHPGFAASWPTLRESLDSSIRVVVDSANVVGAKPDGWWRNRAGATERLAAALCEWSASGVPAVELGLAHERWFPEVTLVTEGEARGARLPADGVRAVVADHDGDSAIVAEVARLVANQRSTSKPTGDAPVFVVTADRELIARVSALGAQIRSPRWLWDQVGDARR